MTGGFTRCAFVATRAVLFVFALFACTLAPSVAHAQQPVAPSTLPSRQANYAWDKTLLRASFSYRDVVDAQIVPKLSSGLPVVIAMRAYVFKEGDSNPLALAVRTCRVTYDLWDEVYRIRVTEPGRSERDTAAVNVEGVLRMCTEARDLPVVDRSLLTAGAPHYLAAIVDVNPISPQMLEQMKRWMSRPTGSTGIGPSDALFGSFAGLFLRQIGTADKTIRFRTQVLTP